MVDLVRRADFSVRSTPSVSSRFMLSLQPDTRKSAVGLKGDIRLGHLSKSRREVLRATGRRNPHIVAGSPQAYP